MSCLARSLFCALLAGVCFERASAWQVVEPSSVENFDIRLNADRAPAGYLQRVGADHTSSLSTARAEQRAQGLTRLQRDYDAIDLVLSPALGTPEVIARAPGAGFLTAPNKGDRAGALRSFLSGYADAYGLSGTDVASLDLAADYANPSGNMAWVELTQRINGVPVFQGAIRGAFTTSGELVATTGILATGVGAPALRSVAAVTAPQALVLAAGSVGWDLDERELVARAGDAAGRLTFAGVGAVRGVRAWPVYFPVTLDLLRLAWATELLGDPMGYLTLVDAEDGSLLFRKSLTEFQSQSATYAIYAGDSPAPWSPTTATPGSGAQALAIGRTRVTLVGNEAPNTFNNEGWVPDHTNATDGNNVQAGVDATLPDGIDALTTGVNRVFDFPYNPAPGSPAPGDVPTSSDYRNGEVTNIFYWSNVFHDRLYRLGFTEAAGNFQKNNFGRGGTDGDPVIAQAQDFGRINNATFQTPADGGPGYMQLSVFTVPNPDRPSGLDRDVILHELTHGTSSRLHGNATGLSSNMSRGMGEGWSDFYARALVATADEDVNGVYPLGSWIGYQHLRTTFTDNYYYGLRRFPYAIKTSVGPNGRPDNPLTLADVDLSQFDISDGAFPPSPNAGGNVDEVHNLGEIWAMALFEVRARFITRLGFNTGNQRILQFVTDGMKLDPLNPTFLQGRDAILAAAAAGGATAADIADIWAGFATRGMGVSAQILQAGTPTGIPGSIGANDTRVIEAFDEPGIGGAAATLATESISNGRLDPGETVGVSLCVANNLTSASGPVTVTLLAGGGVVSPSGAQGYGVVGGHGTACRTFTFTVDAACGATVTASVRAVEQGGVTRTLTYVLPVGSLVPSFAETFDGVTAPALPAGWSTSTLSGTANAWATSATTPDAGANRVFASNLASVSDSVLVSPPTVLPAGANRLTFRHRYVTEWRFDGGLLEIAIGGGAFEDLLRAGGTFVRGAYSGLLQGEPIVGARAWSGFSPRYMTTIAELPAAASGQSIRLRWRMASNGSVARENWSVDSVSIGQIACSPPTSTPPVEPPPVTPPPVTPPPGTPGPPPPPEPAPTVLPPTGLYASSIVGNIVTLRWMPPAQGPAAADYMLEGGILPGQVLASLSLGQVAPAFTFTAPSGAFYVRLRALAGGNRSVASNELRVFVDAPMPPSPPSSLTGLANGDTITLAWRSTFDGGAPTSMALDVAGSINGSFPLGLSEGFSLPGVPAGTYTLAVRAVNSAGSSAASNAITLAFPGGCAGVPEPPANFLAYNIGHFVRIIWDAPASGAAPSSYQLHVSGAVAGSVPLTGDGIAAIAGAGTYRLSVQGMNACGASSVTPAQTIIVP